MGGRLVRSVCYRWTDLKQFNFYKAAREIIPVAYIMLNPNLAEIASAGGQAADQNPGAGINPEVTVKQRQNNLIMLMSVPSGAIPGVREIPPCHTYSVILDQHSPDSAAAL